jgi:hypothetical protein
MLQSTTSTPLLDSLARPTTQPLTQPRIIKPNLLVQTARLALSPPDSQRVSWLCPRTGLLVPKLLADNLKYRQRLLDEAEYNAALQDELRYACKESYLFWVNSFCWTFWQKTVNDAGNEVPVIGNNAHQPFITWQVQDEFAAKLQQCIEDGEDAAIKKSRDMGASWLCLTLLHWFWQFHAAVTFLELSRKEELVDKRGDMDTLFEKHRYLLRMQPHWLRPHRVRDNYMHLENRDLGSTIIGESTNQHAGQAGRKTAVLLDEFGRIENAEEIELSTADTTACRIFNSTPSGPGTGFHKLVLSGRVQVLEMPWWRHPKKAIGAHQIVDPNTGRIKWTSPWYENECKRRSNKDIAQNLDMDFGQAGEVFFDLDEVDRHRKAHVLPPLASGDLRNILDSADSLSKIIKENLTVVIQWDDSPPRERWRLWLSTIDGRPPQHWRYAFACDISNGSGGSNSTASVLCLETHEKVAEFADAFSSPEEFADAVMLAMVWFGGANGYPFLIWENNGPGGIFGRRVVKSGWPRFYKQRVLGQAHEQRTKRYGWHSNRQSKALLLARYRDALKRDDVINHSDAALEECIDYIYDANGRVLPGRIRQENEGGQELHGDRVIADALMVLAKEEAPKHAQGELGARGNTFQYRRKLAENRKKEADPWSN